MPIACRHTVPIEFVRDESPTVRTITFRADIDPAPGQFVMLTDFRTGEKPFSISAMQKGLLSVTLRAVGPFTRGLCQLAGGGIVSIRGAYGSSFFVPNQARVLLIGGGCGTPPLHFLAQRLIDHRNDLLLLNGARESSEVLFSPQFDALGVESRIATEDGSTAPAETVVDLARRVVAEESFDMVYAAGPELMLVSLHSLLGEHGVRHQFLLERYMKCGIGICGSCSMDDTGLRLCVEGPVVDDHTLDDLAEFGAYRRDESGRRKEFT